MYTARDINGIVHRCWETGRLWCNARLYRHRSLDLQQVTCLECLDQREQDHSPVESGLPYDIDGNNRSGE